MIRGPIYWRVSSSPLRFTEGQEVTSRLLDETAHADHFYAYFSEAKANLVSTALLGRQSKVTSND
jgi:hypothetical protein